MFTRCPACQTLFRVQADTLRIAQGLVRCGRCATQFNALDSLADDPEALPGPVAAAEESPVAAAPMDTVPSEEVPSEATPLPVLAPEVIQAALLIEEPAPRSAGPRVAGGVAIVMLLLLLAGQWVYLQRVPLYEHRPALRPALQHVCAVLRCALPLPRMPERVAIIERVVREHPRVAQALLVELSFVNRADQTIAYPLLEMRLSDISGNRVASRRFLPTEYLPRGVDRRAGLRPGQPVQVTLELVEPQIEAVSFQFEFF